jgi:2-polyprenyl-3-methyl-5-hydroxy-6-metoxy-1,4-benzoquinol methylase
MCSSQNAVLDRRVKAAQMSQGISSDPIYAMIQRVIEAKHLRGDILDYGAGAGHLTERLLSLQQFAGVSAADIMPIPAALVGRARWIEQDLNLSLESANATFDVIVAAEVIEHLENPRFMLREIHRLLRPGGTASLPQTTKVGVRFLPSSDAGTLYPLAILAIRRT